MARSLLRGDRHAFDVLIDARSVDEFALDHIPGAVKCPVLNDDECRIVGTISKQPGVSSHAASAQGHL